MLRRTAGDYPPPEPYLDDPYEDEPAPRRRIGGRKTTVVLYAFGLVFLTIAVLRIVGIDGDLITIPVLAVTPYVAVAGPLLFLIAFPLRRRILAVAALVAAISMGVLLLPRMLANDQPGVHGQHVRVLAVPGAGANPAALVNLVRNNNVDVLALSELSQSELSGLADAGLADLLSNQVLALDAGNVSAIVSRFPLRQTASVDIVDQPMPSAIVDLPGRDDIEIVDAHVRSALRGPADVWRRELAHLPPAQPERVRVLAGDFNATLDHAAFRAVLDRGYVDAAEQTGNGLVPTWQSWGPPLTTDHVLADHRCAIRDYAVLDLPGSEHNAVLADLQLP